MAARRSDPDGGSEPRVPPIEPVRRVLAVIEGTGSTAVLGGSALLVALGVASAASDWDVVVDGDADVIERALLDAGFSPQRPGWRRPFESTLLVVDADGARIDVIVGFAIRRDDGALVRIPAVRGGEWNGLPIARPEDWEVAYSAMGRPDSAALLARHAAHSRPTERVYRVAAVDEPDAAELLQEYLDYRIATFPPGRRYRPATPAAATFTPPSGEFVIVDVDGMAIGCGGIRDLGDGRWEVKHLWMRDTARGGGHGRALLAELERRAVAFGAIELVLDTNDSLTAAGALYASAGFERIEPYNDNPNANVWMRKRVQTEDPGAPVDDPRS